MNGAKYIGLHLKLVLVELDVVSVLFARHSLRLFQRLSFHPVLTPAVKFHSCSSQVNCDFMHTGVRSIDVKDLLLISWLMVDVDLGDEQGEVYGE